MQAVASRADRRFKIRAKLLALTSIVVFVLAWHAAVAIIRPELTPGPAAVAQALFESVQSGRLFKNVGGSLARVMIGFSAASLLGIAVGFLIGNCDLANRIFSPVLEILRPIPPIAWIPLAIAFFGIGDPPSYFVIFIGAFYPIFTNTALGLREIPTKYLEAGLVLGVSSLRRYKEIIWPGALPSIFTGLRIALGFAWMCLVAAEMIAVKSGLGDQIQLDRLQLRLDRVVAGMLAIGFLGYAMSLLMSWLESCALPWRRSNCQPNASDEPAPRVPEIISRDLAAVLLRSSGSHVEINKLTFGFQSDHNLFEDLSLRLTPGEIVAVMGSSGCGKTTLLRVLAGLLPPRSGTISVDGDAIRGPDDRVTMVFQDDALFPWKTAHGNVVFAYRPEDADDAAKHSSADALLSLIGLSHKSSFYPAQLSGGQRQRVGMARALANAPKLLLMDEPFGALDSLTRTALQQDVSALLAEATTTVILVTHDVPEAVFMADRIFVFGSGTRSLFEVLAVPVARPRRAVFRHSSEFAEYSRKLWACVNSTQHGVTSYESH